MQDSYKFPDPTETEIEAVGGEALAGSGFESEETEPDFDDAVEGVGE